MLEGALADDLTAEADAVSFQPHTRADQISEALLLNESAHGKDERRCRSTCAVRRKPLQGEPVVDPDDPLGAVDARQVFPVVVAYRNDETCRPELASQLIPADGVGVDILGRGCEEEEE